MTTRTSALLLALLLAAPAVGAQEAEIEDPLARPVRAQVGGSLYYARPLGDFADRIEQGWGGNLHGTLLLGEPGAIGLRFDAGFMGYGRERYRDCLTSTCLVEADITVSNNLAWIGVGPQLQVPVGPLRPYVAGQVGWTWLWTDSEIEGTNNDNQPFASSTNFSDNVFSYGGTAGVLIPVSQGANPIAIDLGARWLRNGEVEYLREGDIVINPGNRPTLLVQRSRADLVLYYVGVTVGVR